MARIERTSSEQAFDVEQAQLIDPSGFRFSTAGAEAMQQIGGTLFELGRRDLAAKNSLAVNAASESRRLAKLKMEEFIKNNPDPDTWSEGARKFIEEQVKTYSQQRFNKETGAQQEIEQDAFKDQLTMEVGIAAVAQNIENDIAINGKNLIDVISTDDGTPDAADEIDKQIKLYQEALERKYEPKVAALQMEETLKEAQKLQVENVKKDIMNRAAVRPELIKDFIETELKARAKDKKAFGEFNLLSNSNLEAIRDYANSVGEKAVSDSEITVNAAIVDSYGRIRDGDVDIDSMIDAIDADPTISDKDKLLAAEKIPTYFNKINSIKVADESNEDIYDELTRASESVERGTMSPAAFEELYADKKGELDKDDQRTIRSKDIVATKTMQNRAFTDAMSATLPTLVELTESDLGAIKLARQNAEVIKDIAAINLFNIAIKKNQAERWNYGRFRKQLRTQIDQNPEWSQKQIYVAQEILMEQLDMPVDQLLKEFDNQNPDKAIMKTPPSIDFKDIWLDLSIDDKAKVWELTMRGAPAEAILGAIE